MSYLPFFCPSYRCIISIDLLKGVLFRRAKIQTIQLSYLVEKYKYAVAL